MTPHQEDRINDAFKQGVDALRFIWPHLDTGDGISEECAQYLVQKTDELDVIIKAMPEWVPPAKFCRIRGRYVEQGE